MNSTVAPPGAAGTDLIPAGTKKLSSQEKLMQEIRKKYPEYHPVLAMVDLAQTSDNESIKFVCHREVAKYTVVVDKHVEIDEKVTRTRRVIVELFGAPTHGANSLSPLTFDAESSVLIGYSDTEALVTAVDAPHSFAAAAQAAAAQSSVVERRTRVRSSGPIEPNDPTSTSDDGPGASHDAPNEPSPPVSSRLARW